MFLNYEYTGNEVHVNSSGWSYMVAVYRHRLTGHIKTVMLA